MRKALAFSLFALVTAVVPVDEHLKQLQKEIDALASPDEAGAAMDTRASHKVEEQDLGQFVIDKLLKNEQFVAWFKTMQDAARNANCQDYESYDWGVWAGLVKPNMALICMHESWKRAWDKEMCIQFGKHC